MSSSVTARHLYGSTIEIPYRFCLSLADTDTPDLGDQKSMVSTCPNRKWGDPTTWETLILVDW